MESSLRNQEVIRRILYVEDNPGDVLLLRLSMDEIGLDVELIEAQDGDAANLVVERHKQSDWHKISLVLLDLNLPRKSGLELLSEWKSDPDFCKTPIVVFTSSMAPKDIADAYRLGANSYLKKPDDLEEYRRVAKSLYDYWLQVVLPP